MALKIIDKKIVGTIDNLQDKLEGKLPIDRLELLYLINSWGRSETLVTNNNNVEIKIEISKCQAKECYDLSKLDVSQITNMENIFCLSNFTDIYSRDGIKLHNGDISKWDVSNVTSMYGMFGRAKKFNSDISNWDVSNVTSMRYMFFYAINFNQDLNSWNTSKTTNMSSVFCNALNFNGNISNWDTSNVTNISSIFFEAKAFLNKYNNGEPLPYNTKKIKEWFNNNRDKMNEIDIKVKHGEDIDNFFSNINLKKYNLLTECNKQ